MKKKLEKEFDVLKQEKIIDEETFKRIQSYYMKKESKASYSTLLTILASSLIGLGIILLFAYNWGVITVYGKLSLTIGLLIISQFVSYRCMEKKKIREGASLFQGLMVGLNIAYISQVFNISGDIDRFFLVWMILILPLVYTMKSRILYLGYLGLILAYTKGEYYYSLVGLLVLVTPFLYFIRGKHLGETLNKITAVFFFVSTGIYLEEMLEGNQVIVILYVIIILLIGYLSISKKISEVLLLILIYIFSFSDMYSKDVTFKNLNMFSLVLITIFGAFLLYRGMNLKKDKSYEKTLYLSLLIPISIVVPMGYLGVTAYLIILGFIYFYRYKNMDKKYDLNLSILIFGAIIMTKFSLGNSIITKGIVFVALGVLCLIINKFITKRNKKGDLDA